MNCRASRVGAGSAQPADCRQHHITRWLAWRGGYSVFWLSGVATAPQQFAASDFAESTGTVNTNGSVLLHGVTTGLEARW